MVLCAMTPLDRYMGANVARNMPPPSSGTSVLKAVGSSEDLVYAYLHGVIMQKTTM